MTKLNLNLNTFGFVKRENDKNRKRKKNRRGRDGLYFVLHFFYPDIFAPNLLSPEKIEEKRLFGFLVPKYLPFGGVMFSRILNLFNKYNLSIEVNRVKIKTNLSFLKNYIFPKKLLWSEAKKIIEENLNTRLFVKSVD